MKRSLFSFVLLLAVCFTGFSQPLTGTFTIPGTLPTGYPTIAAAIADLNLKGAGAGGVTFNIAANFKEGFVNATAGYITTLTGSASNPIVFQKSGAGLNPLITAPAGNSLTGMDAIIAVAGCDFITFDGIDLMENPSNVTPEMQMEWGFAILRQSGTNGSRNITIKNCSVSLDKYNPGTKGIYSNNHTTGDFAGLVITTTEGANSNLKIFSNVVSNCYSGIYISGYADQVLPYQYYDQNNEIGKDGANVISNYGGGEQPAYAIFTKFQNNLEVANNNVNGIIDGSATHYGIFLTTALNGSYELYGNFVSLQFYGSGSSTSFYPVFCDMGGNGTSNTVAVFNNTITGCAFPTASGSNQYTYFMYLNNMGVTSNVYGNIISNNSVGAGDVSATGRVWYLACNMVNTIPGSLELHDNTITGNARIQFEPGGGLTNFLVANGSGNLLNMYNNLIDNNIIASNTGTNILYALINAASKNIYNNTVSNIFQAEGPVYGLYFSNYTAGTSNVYNNKIRNIEGLTGGSSINGIYHSSGNSTYYYNNMVSDLKAPGASTTSSYSNQLNGIYVNQGTDVGVYYNTVYLASPISSGANFGSSALCINAATIVDSRNNILVNNSLPVGLGKTVAFRILGSNGFTYYSMLSNYNNLFAGTPDAAHLVFSWYDNSALIYTDDQTLSDYKIRVYPREQQSVTELPPFVNIVSSPYDIHLKSNVATQCESGGIAISNPVPVMNDIDNNPRFPYPGFPVNPLFAPNAPDIGADEVGGLPNDITAPVISYTPLTNINNGNARTLTVTITDGSGVPISGYGLPMVYWTVNGGYYQGVQGNHQTGNTYAFTFGAGVSTGDVISYYVVAQDNAPVPNVGVYPFIGAGGLSYNPPVCATPPATPSSYTIVLGIAGVFHVGTGKDFNTLTAAANMINTRVLEGPVTLILDDATYPAEVFPVVFSSNPGSSSVNTLTIMPNAGASPVLSTSTGDGLLNLDGIDYFILDGSNNGTNSKNLKIAHTNTTVNFSYGIKVFNKGGNDPATNVTIKNCTVQCTPVHSSIRLRAPIIFSYSGGGYDDCIIDNNTIIGGFDGIQMFGAITGVIHNAQITNNIIGSVTDSLSTITRIGIYIEYADNTLIFNNHIMGPYTGSLNSGMTGIQIGIGSTNTKVRNNRIHEIYNNNPYDGWGARGIEYASDASSVTEITNNLIYDIKGGGSAPGLAGTNPYGILISNGGNLRILFNTIYLSGPYLSSQHDASSACIAITKKVQDNSLEIRNNIFQNSMECNGAPNYYGKAYGIILEGEASKFSFINNNDYFIDGFEGKIAQQFLQTGITDFPTLASWQLFTGQEANSVNIDPAFSTTQALMPTAVNLNNKGSFVNWIPTDIAGLLRNDPPDVGAYEFGSDPLVTTLPAHSVSSNGAVVAGSVNPAGNAVSTFFDYGKTTGYGTSAAATPASAGGYATTGFQLSVSGLNPSTLYHYRARTVTTSGLISFGADMTFTTTTGPPENLTVTDTIAIDTCFNATSTITVAGTPQTFVVAATGHVTMIAGEKILLLPGTKVLPGGYLHGYISNEYCGETKTPFVASGTGQAETPSMSEKSFIRIYPNPTSGNITLELLGNNEPDRSRVEIFSMRGDKVFNSEISGTGKHQLSLSDDAAGIYLVRVITGNKMETVRIIKQ